MFNNQSFAAKVFWKLTIVTLILLGVHLGMQYLNLEVYGEKHGQVFELSNRLDMDDEVSLPTWYSQFLLLVAGLAAILVGRLESQRSSKRLWLLIGLVGVVFSIDEVASIHELVLQSAHLLYYGEMVPTAALNAWWLALPFIAAGCLAFLWWLYKLLPTRTTILFFIGGLIYMTGAAGFELFSNDLAKNTYMYQGVFTGIEESLELIGNIVVIYAIMSYLETIHIPVLLAAAKTLKLINADNA